ncbi:MAG: ribonuclease E/G [Galbitalea sp.]
MLLHSEPDLLVKIVRDVFNEDFQKLVVAGDDAMQTISAYLRAVAPDLLERLETYDEPGDAFDTYRISEQIEKALDRKVWLPSGGSLVIDRTEAMTVVDVNTGKFVGSGGNLEETVTKNNLEAAEEIVRQLRLRDIGGIIVVDFIDMVLESNRDLVLRRLVGVPQPRPHQAPGRRGHLAGSRADDAQEARARSARIVQRAVRALRGTRCDRAPRSRRAAPPERPAPPRGQRRPPWARRQGSRILGPGSTAPRAGASAPRGE